LQARGVELFEVERGGDVTFHGPGQLVGYPIVDLKRHRKDLHWYLRQVEEALIQALATYSVPAGRVEGYTGVWVQDVIPSGEVILSEAKDPAPSPVADAAGAGARKIASIGVHARDWVTWHGFALNVSTDLSYFDLMVPCGIAEVTMTSLARELRSAGEPAPALADVGARVAAAFGALFELAAVDRPVEALGDAAEASWIPGAPPG
ncbi:MAG: lipoyl(octanoyl) transferase, partial [Acidimicrobiales bacterium]